MNNHGIPPVSLRVKPPVSQPVHLAQLVTTEPSDSAGKVLVRGIGLEITPSLRTAVITKVGRLLRHHDRIIRVRIEFEQGSANDATRSAVAHGRVEIRGPDLIARVAGGSVARSLDLLIDKLDRMVRELRKYRANRRNDRSPGAEFRDLFAVA